MNNFVVQLIYPSICSDQSHCLLFNKTLLDRMSRNPEQSPILCPCIPEPNLSHTYEVLHTYKKTKDFVLQQSYAQNVIKWLHANKFHIWYINKSNGMHSIYLIKEHEKYMILYECCDEYTCIKLIYYPFIEYSVKNSLIPLLSILQKKEDRQQLYSVSKENSKRVAKDSASIEELISMYRNEIAFNYALFHSLSSLFCWSLSSDKTHLRDPELYVYCIIH